MRPQSVAERLSSRRLPAAALLGIVLVIATAGLVYELVMAAVASYLLGDSVRQFSLVVGVYLSALGLGAYLSRYIDRSLGAAFVDIELAAAVVGGLSAPCLFLAFAFTQVFQIALYGLVLFTGILVGLELPLLIRILEGHVSLKDLIARALTFDYMGALVGSLAFSLYLVPHVGLVHTSLSAGVLNAAVGLASTWLLPAASKDERGRLGSARLRAIFVLLLLGVALLEGKRVTDLADNTLYPGRVVLSQHSNYQQITVVAHERRFELFLDGNLQFSSADEYRYHEALVHPAMAATPGPRRVLVGGGGDGLAVRELLRWKDVVSVTLVDIDPDMTALGETFAPLVSLNARSLTDPRVTVIHDDAMRWLRDARSRFDVIILDFPDPTHYSTGKLYSRTFYEFAKARLQDDGTLVTQASSPFFGRKSYWCIVTTLESAGFHVAPYHAFVPSFADWGFVLAKHHAFSPPAALPKMSLRFLDDGMLRAMFGFPADVSRIPTGINRLNNQALVAYYNEEWPR